MVQTVVEEQGKVPMSLALQASLRRARDYASIQGHLQVSLEHLLLALTEDDDAATVLQACRIDLVRLRNDVAGHIGAETERTSDGNPSEPGISTGLTLILKYATLAARQGRRPRIDGAIVLAAIIGEGQSMAAAFLKAQGLTFEAAIRALQQAATPQARRGPPAADPVPQPDAGPLSAPGMGPGLTTRPPPAGRTLGSSTEDILAAARARIEQRGVPLRADLQPGLEPAPSPRAYPVAPELATEAEAALPHASARPEAAFVPPEQLSLSELPPLPLPPAATEPPQLSLPPLPNDDAFAVPTQGEPDPPFARPPVMVQPGPVLAASAAALAPPMPYSVAAAPAPPSGWAPPPMPPMPRPKAAPRPLAEARPPHPAAVPGPFALPPRQPAPTPAFQPPPRSEATDLRPPFAPPAPHARPVPQERPAERPPALDASQVTHTIPSRLKVGVPRTVEVRVVRSPLPSVSTTQPLSLRGEAVSVRAVSVRLRPARNGFAVDAPSPETLWEKPSQSGRLAGEAAVWRFVVTPSRRGAGELSLQVTAHVVGADGIVAETALGEQLVPVRSMPNLAVIARRVAVAAGLVIATLVVAEAVDAWLGWSLLAVARRIIGV